MKGRTFRSNSALSSLLCLFITLLLLTPYQEAFSADRAAVVATLNGKVIIKLEPHGSIRAKVFKGQTLQYEFILDRVTRQKLLTQTIDRTTIYLAGNGDELVIYSTVASRGMVVLTTYLHHKNVIYRHILPTHHNSIG